MKSNSIWPFVADFISLSIISFKIHPWCSMSQNFLPSYGWIIFCYMERPHLVCLVICSWALVIVPAFGYRELCCSGFDIVVQSLSCVWLFATLGTAARQAALSFTISQSLLKLLSIVLMLPCNHLILCHPLLLPLTFPSIWVFTNGSAFHIKWPKYGSWKLQL